MRKLRNIPFCKITFIFVVGILLLAPAGCNKKTTASGTSKTIKKKKIKCSGCKTKTASYSFIKEFNNQHQTKIA